MKVTKSILFILAIFAFQNGVKAQSAENFKLKHHWSDPSLKGSWIFNNT